MEPLQQRSEREVHLRDYLRVIFRRRWAVIACFVVVVVTVTVGTFAAKPVYRATCQVLIERENPDMVKIEEMLAVDANSTDYYQTQYEILKSKLLAQRSIQKLDLEDNPEFNPKPKKRWFSPQKFLAAALRKIKILPSSPEHEGEQLPDRENRLINAYENRLTIQPIRNSRLVNISFDSHDPKLAALLANTHAKVYMEYNLERKFTISQDAVAWLDKKIKEIQGELDASGQGDFKERDDLIAQNLRNLNDALTLGKTEGNKKHNLYPGLNKSSSNPSSITSVTEVLQNPLIQELKAQLVRLEGELSERSKKYGPKHPQMIRLGSQIAQVRAKIDQEISKITHNIDTEHRIILAKEISLISIVDPARVPDTPAKPNKRLNVLLAVLVGLMGGVGVAFFFEYLDPSIKSSEEIEAQLGMPFLGHVANITSVLAGKGKNDGALITLRHPTSHSAEEFRTIATNILFSIPDKPGKSIIITSALAEEGKTTMAANLAIVMAQIGKRVLLIDADMRRPAIHSLFDLERAPGLSDFLAQGADLASIVHQPPVKDLFVISAGTPPPNPSALLLSQKMADFITSMREKYDLVILDSPPVIMMSDTPAMASVVDGMVMIIKSGVTPRPTVQKAVHQLAQVAAKLTGAVLNCHDIKREGYYYHYYRDYYHRYYGREGKGNRV